MTTFLLVRHGETDWNADGRLQGQTDRPLSEFGRRQAQQLADELVDHELDAIYASDLARARETAEIVGGRLGRLVALDADLREKDWGTWEGLTAVERDRVEFVGESTEAHLERAPCARCETSPSGIPGAASSSSPTVGRCDASKPWLSGSRYRLSRTAAGGSAHTRTGPSAH